ncbi:MAG: PTS sugar transporter subunit IIA, partial [Sandaracinaceae bacterium]|nr:PTS sugar transporter subunit IIA [Sandaracinaceae bacterium]
LEELLDLSSIDADLHVASKEDVLAAVARLLSARASSVGCRVSVEDVYRVLEAREAQQSTGVGRGVAIPHARLKTIDRFVGALAIHKEGVAFDAIDGMPVSIFFALLGPEEFPVEHLKCLARIGRLLRDQNIRQRLQQAESAVDALSIIREADAD